MAIKRSVEERLIESAKQALSIRRGQRAPAQAYDLPLTARDASAEEAPSYSKAQIAKIREKLGLSQAVFADALNVSLGTVRSWEQGYRYPEGAATRLLQVVERRPEILSAYVRSKSARTVVRSTADGRFVHVAHGTKLRAGKARSHNAVRSKARKK